MTPVTFALQIEHTMGCLGFSYLFDSLVSGRIERTTLLFLRDGEGFAQSCVTIPAETLGGMR